MFKGRLTRDVGVVVFWKSRKTKDALHFKHRDDLTLKKKKFASPRIYFSIDSASNTICSPCPLILFLFTSVKFFFIWWISSDRPLTPSNHNRAERTLMVPEWIKLSLQRSQIHSQAEPRPPLRCKFSTQVFWSSSELKTKGSAYSKTIYIYTYTYIKVMVQCLWGHMPI